MICDSCKTGAYFNSQHKTKDAQDFHNNCKGCECQHKTGVGWFARKGEAVPPMRTQSP